MKLTHLDVRGKAKMVDVSGKPVQVREAVALGEVRLKPATLRLIRSNRVAKGDVLNTARVAGIQAAKRTGGLIPLCHPLNLTHVDVDLQLKRGRIVITGTARIAAQTGVEMEALTAVAVAALTIYDMCKAVDKQMVIGEIRGRLEDEEMIATGIITVSDRAFRGQYEDKSGPALREFCEKRGWNVTGQAVVPDEEAIIGDRTLELAKTCSLVLLTGGTGIAERDVTPGAVSAVATKELPGFGEVMRAKSFERFPHAILSRNMAAVVGKALVITLPGSPRGAVECLEFVAEAVPHAIELLRGDSTDHRSR